MKMKLLPKKLADIIYQLAKGNPFYALELFFHYRGNGNRFLSEKLEAMNYHPLQHTQKIPPPPPFFPILLEFLSTAEKLESHSPAARHMQFIAAVLAATYTSPKILSSM